MKPEEKKDRAVLTSEMLVGAWYKKYFEPELEKKVARVRDIKALDEKELENSYIKNKVKLDVYQGILTMLKAWSNQSDLPED